MGLVRTEHPSPTAQQPSMGNKHFTACAKSMNARPMDGDMSAWEDSILEEGEFGGRPVDTQSWIESMIAVVRREVKSAYTCGEATKRERLRNLYRLLKQDQSAKPEAVKTVLEALRVVI